MLEHSDYGADLDAHLERVSSVDDYDAAAPAYRSLQFEWLVVAFGIGIGLYFALPIEPPLWLAAGVGAGAFIAIISFTRLLSRQGLSKFRAGLLILAVLIFGLGRATWHTKAIEAPILPDYRMAYNVTGWIEAVEMSGSGFRWRIRVDDMKLGARSLRADERPVRVRIRAKRAGLSPGDGVSVKAFMTGPPGPVIEDGYDPARRAYFKQIGGYGFAISTPVAADVSASRLDAARRKLAQTRHAMAQRIIAASPEQTAGLQAALLTGERAYIKKELTESLRGAGLAHVLAISGLHMGLMAGGAFWLVAFVLAAIEPIG
ncbi:MAG: ComEC/Rec2 family competence protein, partial [Robiginitomaculum sp.]